MPEGQNYDPTRTYAKGENIPRHGSKSTRKKKNYTMPQRGVSVAGTGKISASGDKSLRKKTR